MTEDHKPPLDEISASVKVDENGLTAGVKSRFATAVDRLAANFVDIPNAYLEGRKAKKAIERQFSLEAARIEGQAALEQLKANTGLGGPLAERWLRDQSRKHNNLDAIVIEATEVIKQLPPPSPEDDTARLGDDWLNYFASYAEKASSEELRKLWGRVLAGEIRKPKSYSLTTMRFLSEVDAEIANVFQELALVRSSDNQHIPRPEPYSGDRLDKLIFLQEIGLAQQINAFNMQATLRPTATHITIGWRRSVGDLMLYIKPAPNVETISIPVIPLTRVGRELAQILPEESQEKFLEAISRQISSDAESIDVLRIESNIDGNLSTTLLHSLR